MIGILCAMELEMQELVDLLEDMRCESFASVSYYSGKLFGHDTVICNCGVGKVNAAMHTQLLIDNYHPDALIMNGIAGALSPAVNYFDVVIASELVYHDMQNWVLQQFEPLQEVYYTDPHLTQLTIDSIDCPYHLGRVATGDLFVAGKNMKQDIYDRTGALCAEMEGCAVAHTATLNNIPYTIIRTISDMADGTAEEDFSVFQQKAADRAVKIVCSLIKNL